MVKKSFIISTILCFILCSFSQMYGKEINKTYAKKECVELKAVLGSCKLIRSEDDMLHISLIYSFNDEEFHAEFSESADTISLEEKISGGSPQGISLWLISIPGNTKINFKSATGSFRAVGVESYFQVETGTGSITIDKARGNFNVSTGTGSIEINEIIIEGESRFTSGTGNVSVTLSGSPDQDVSITSGTGNAILDYQGNPLKGIFKFSAVQNSGRIISPVNFENEYTVPNGNLFNEIKSFQIDGNDKPQINISTGTGLAKLIK